MDYIRAIEQGMTREASAPLIGLTPERLRFIIEVGKREVMRHGPVWLESDEAFEGGHGEAGRLCMYTLRAESRMEQILVARMFSSDSWKASQSLLERRFPERWAKMDRDKAMKVKGAEKKARPGIDAATADDLRRKVLGVKT